MSGRFSGKRLSALKTYFLVSVVLNFIWEAVQLPLYTIWRTGTVREIAFALVHCTLGDAMIAALSLGAALLIFGHKSRSVERNGQVSTATVLTGLAYTVFSEWLNTVVRQSWAYSDQMPTLPVLGTGISPLLQWVIVPTVALYFASVRLSGGSTTRD